MKPRSKYFGLTVLTTGLLGALAISLSALAGEQSCSLRIPGMQCEMCVSGVKDALSAVPGVKAVRVDLQSHRADVVADEGVKPTELIGAVKKAGFKAEVSKPAEQPPGASRQ